MICDVRGKVGFELVNQKSLGVCTKHNGGLVKVSDFYKHFQVYKYVGKIKLNTFKQILIFVFVKHCLCKYNLAVL